jgi:hypothetical protein
VIKEIFYTETNLKCQATLDSDGSVVNVQLLSKVPRGYYYSCLNEALLTAEEKYPTKKATDEIHHS